MSLGISKVLVKFSSFLFLFKVIIHKPACSMQYRARKRLFCSWFGLVIKKKGALALGPILPFRPCLLITIFLRFSVTLNLAAYAYIIKYK